MVALTVKPLRIALVAALAGLALAGCGGTGGTPTAEDIPQQDLPVVEAPVVSPPTHIDIPKIGSESDLIPLGLDEVGSMEVPAEAMVAGYFAGADPAFEGDEVLPGEAGPSVVAGHVDWNGALGIFNRLDELTPGDSIFIDQADGARLEFVVTNTEQVDKDEFPTDRVWGNTDKPELRLITCGGALDRSIGHYEQNFIAYAELVA